MPLKSFDLKTVLQELGSSTESQRRLARLLHRGGDIRAAGDEVEAPVRALVSDWLPRAYHVTHGHIVDSKLLQSPQVDIIVADAAVAPILFSGAGGPEYLAYESVYAIGEVKSTFDRSKEPVETFSKSIEAVVTEMSRAPTTGDHISRGFTVPGGLPLVQYTGVVPRNRLFTFMVFVSGGDLDPIALGDYLASRPLAFLPNVICILDTGVIVNTRVKKERKQIVQVNIEPACAPAPPEGEVDRWASLPLGPSDVRAGLSLGFLMAALNRCVSECILQPSDMFVYVDKLFDHATGSSLLLTKAEAAAARLLW